MYTSIFATLRSWHENCRPYLGYVWVVPLKPTILESTLTSYLRPQSWAVVQTSLLIRYPSVGLRVAHFFVDLWTILRNVWLFWGIRNVRLLFNFARGLHFLSSVLKYIVCRAVLIIYLGVNLIQFWTSILFHSEVSSQFQFRNHYISVCNTPHCMLSRPRVESTECWR